jgi:hypothetical protein
VSLAQLYDALPTLECQLRCPEYCDLLAQHNGDTTRTDAQLAGQARLFTAPVLHTLRIAATTAYCP